MNSHAPAARRAPGAALLAGLVVLLAGALLAWRARPALLAEPAGPVLLEVTGREFEWHVRYAGADGHLGTADDRRTKGGPHLPADTQVTLRLTSADYLYSFAVPALGINEVAIPERTHELSFRTASATTLELRGDQFCGFSHTRLMSTIRVEAREEFSAWSRELESAL